MAANTVPVIAMLEKVVVIIIGIVLWKKLNSVYLKIFFFQNVLALIAELTGFYISFQEDNNNLWVFHINAIIELWLLTLAALSLTKNSLIRKVSVFLLVSGSLLWCYEIYERGIRNWLSWFTLFHYSFLFVFYIYILITRTLFEKTSITKNPIFWVSLSVLLYYCGALPYFGFFNYMYYKFPDVMAKLSKINLVLDLVRYPLVGLAFIISSKQIEYKSVK